MPDPLFRYFTQAVKPLDFTSETLVAAAFSQEFNDLQNPGKSWGISYQHKLIH
ncbi:hypothetical protein SAMN04489798_2405 [Pseudomonas arsenicoxydans]|uniref:Uncharacterized protein n=1 Tax=Pseudomonas arsenicoxydans TaxID=702115 RepID=A0A1H0HWM8_9PSED|nr:hypothetical protein SAMN04489798_2405 [Pseudomonas arsenicoxydans]